MPEATRTSRRKAVREAKAAPAFAVNGVSVTRDELLLMLVTGESPAPAVAKAEAKVKPRVWAAFWVAKNGLPTTKGATFEYVSKKHGTTSVHKVVAVLKDGSIKTERVSLTRA